MGDGTKENPYTREDVLRLIEENGGKAEGLDLSNQKFVEAIDLSDLDLSGIKINYVRLFRANFNGSNLDRAIMQKAYLGYATFNPLESKVASLQGVDLRWANLHDAEFREADLSAAQFQETRFQGVIHPPELQDKLLELLPASLDRTDFRDANLFRANFKGCYFYGTKLEGAHIRGADITEAHLEEVDWGSYIAGEEISKEFYFAEHVYRRLKLWYRDAGMYDIAAKFYYREKEANKKSLKLFSKSWNHRIASQLSYWVFGHGEDWKRLLFWIAGFILLFALIYFSVGTLTPNTFLNSLYYSAVSFIALGYGSWIKEATGWVKGLGVFETFLGFFMMTLLLVTFVRKWTR
jgi:hypothetical protein